MSTKRVADVLVDTLLAAGVERIYGLAGDSLNGIKAVINGRDDELVDLAKINLFRLRCVKNATYVEAAFFISQHHRRHAL
jgi:hypothetical protein